MKGQNYKTSRAGVVYPLLQKNAARFQFKATLATSLALNAMKSKYGLFKLQETIYSLDCVVSLFIKDKKKDELMNYLMVANLFVCLDNFICNSFGIQF